MISTTQQKFAEQTAAFTVNENDWSRVDMTFAANGADGEFIGDGSNYTDVYYY